MGGLSGEQAARRQKTLLIALLLSAPGPIFTGLAVLNSQSTTQLADFLRRGVELVALFLSWWVFRKLHRSPHTGAEQARLERIAGFSVAGAMLVSGMIMLLIALVRSQSMTAGGSVTAGLVIAVLGLLTNGFFWLRYRAMTREQYSAVIASQLSLYRAKASIDLAVVIALGAVALAPAHPLTPVIDLAGSVIVAGYLLWSGVRMAQTHLGARSAAPEARAG